MTTVCQVAREQSDGTCTRVNFDVIGLGGDLAIARDVGQPNAKVLQAGGDSSGRELPRTQSDLSGGDRLVVVGELQGSSAYADAKTIVDDIVKPFVPALDDDGNELARGKVSELGIDFHGPRVFGAEVGFVGEEALALEYEPGVTDKVRVRLVASIVSCLNLGGGFKPTAGTKQGSIAASSLTGVAKLFNPVVDVSNSDYVYCVDDDNDQYVALDVSDPSNITKNDTISTAGSHDLAAAVDTQLIAHPGGSYIYHPSENQIINLTSAGTFNSTTEDTDLVGNGGVAVGDNLYTAQFGTRIWQFDISTRTNVSLVGNTNTVSPNDDSNLSFAARDSDGIIWFRSDFSGMVGIDLDSNNNPINVGFGNPGQAVRNQATEQWAWDDSQNRLYYYDIQNVELVVVDVTN